MNHLIENEIETSPHIIIEKKIEKAVKDCAGNISRTDLMRKIRIPATELDKGLDSLFEKELIKIFDENVVRAQSGGKNKVIIQWLGD